MKKAKTLDCVEMKNAIQARMLRETAGMTDEEERAWMRHLLDTDNSTTARFWRKVNWASK